MDRGPVSNPDSPEAAGAESDHGAETHTDDPLPLPEDLTPRVPTPISDAPERFAGDAPSPQHHDALAEAVPPSAALPSRNPAVNAYIRAIFSPLGIRTLAWIAGAVIAAGLVGASLLMAAALGSANGAVPEFGQFIAGLLLGLGTALGGGIAVDANVDAGFLSVSGSGAITVIPLGVYAALVAGVAVAARVRLRSDRIDAPTLGAEVARAGIEAGLIALMVTILTGFVRVGGGAGFGGLELSTRPGLTFLSVLIAVAVTLVLSRTSLRRRTRGTVDGPWAIGLRESGRYFAVLLVVFGVVAMVALVMFAAQADNGALLAAGLPLLGNVALAAASIGHLGGVSVTLGSGLSETVSVFEVPDGFGIWLVFAALLNVVAAAGVIGVRRQRVQRAVWSRVWQFPLLAFGIWVVLSLGVAGVRIGGDLTSFASIGADVSVGLSWVTPFVMGVAAALTSIAAEYAPLVAYRIHPRLLALFGGRRATHEWLVGSAAIPATAVFDTVAPGRAVTGTSTTPAVTGPAEPSEQDALPSLGLPDSSFPSGDVPISMLPPREPMSPGIKRGIIVGLSIVGLVAVLAAGAAVTVSLLNQQRDPSQTVKHYLGLLSEGRADSATELVDPGVKNSDRVLLTDEVLGAAEVRLEVVGLETIERSDEYATVSATLSLDGERFERIFSLRAGPKEYSVLDTWELEQPLLVPVVLSAEGAEALTVGQTEVALEPTEFEDGFSKALYVYPGIYSVSGASTEYVEQSTEMLRATPEESSRGQSVTITATPSAQFETEVLQQVQARIQQCVEIPTNLDEVCPYITRDDDLAEMKVVTQPDGFEHLSLTEFVSLQGEIAVRSNPGLFDREPELRESPVQVSGGIVFKNGKPRIEDPHMNTWGW